MSVINQMLKDLDKREQSLTVRALPTAVVTAPVASSASSKRFYALLIAVLTFTSVGAWLWFKPLGAQIGAPESLATPSGDLPVTSADSALTTDAKPAQTPTMSQDEQITATELANHADAPVTIDKASGTGDSVVTTEPVSHPANVESELLEQKLPQPQLEIAAEPQPKAAPAPKVTQSAVDEKINAIPANKIEAPEASTMAVTEVSMSPDALAQQAIIKARKAEQSGRLEDAVSFYADALFQKNDSHDARRRLAALLYGKGEIDEAIRLLEAGQLNYPEERSFALLLAKLWFERGDMMKAQASLERIGDDPQYQRDKWLLLADIARNTQNHGLAEQSYTRLLAGGDDKPSWWLGLAYAQDAQGKFNDAADSYRRSLAGNGLSEDARQFAKDRLLQLGGNR